MLEIIINIFFIQTAILIIYFGNTRSLFWSSCIFIYFKGCRYCLCCPCSALLVDGQIWQSAVVLGVRTSFQQPFYNKFQRFFAMADVRSLEHPTLKVFPTIFNNLQTNKRLLQVPYEILNKKFRTTQKTLDREVSHVQQAASEIEKTIAAENVNTKDITSLLGGMVEKLQVLKRKAEESISEELQATNVCKKRIEHLKEHASATASGKVSTGSVNQWRRKRIDRMVVEYFLRNGYYNAAITLAERSNIKDLTNIGKYIFLWFIRVAFVLYNVAVYF